MEFKSEIIEILKSYIYIYSDPDTKIPFYIGKDKANRCFEHLKDESETKKVEKLNELKKVEYAFSVFQGIVKEVYKIERWHPAGTLEYKYRDIIDYIGANRWEFEGSIAQESIRSKYVGKSIRQYVSK